MSDSEKGNPAADALIDVLCSLADLGRKSKGLPPKHVELRAYSSAPVFPEPTRIVPNSYDIDQCRAIYEAVKSRKYYRHIDGLLTGSPIREWTDWKQADRDFDVEPGQAKRMYDYYARMKMQESSNEK
jgi:hypothetical protein